MSFLWLLILYDFKSNEMSCQKFRILIKEVCLLMCIFPGLWTNTDFKSILVFMTQKSPDFSQKVWLLSSLVERKWWLQMVVVFPVWSQTMSRPFHSRGWFWGGTEWGRLERTLGRNEGRVCSFGGGTEGRKTFLLMWLSCPRLSYFSRTTLTCLSLIVSVFPVSMSYRSLTFIGVFCSTVGITHTSQSGQSPHDMRVKKNLSVFLSLPDSVADCHHSQTVFSTALSVPAVRLWLPKAQSNKVNPPSHGGGARWVGLSLSVLSLPDSVADSHHSHTDQHCPLSACCAIVFASKPRSPR